VSDRISCAHFGVFVMRLNVSLCSADMSVVSIDSDTDTANPTLERWSGPGPRKKCVT
jgi:hypothetical protein